MLTFGRFYELVNILSFKLSAELFICAFSIIGRLNSSI